MSEDIGLMQLFEKGLINEYFYNKLINSASFEVLPDDLKDEYMSDVFRMSEAGVSSVEDERRFFCNF